MTVKVYIFNVQSLWNFSLKTNNSNNKSMQNYNNFPQTCNNVTNMQKFPQACKKATMQSGTSHKLIVIHSENS